MAVLELLNYHYFMFITFIINYDVWCVCVQYVWCGSSYAAGVGKSLPYHGHFFELLEELFLSTTPITKIELDY